jgi:ferritin-like metal-binding protein YciE
LKEAFAEHLQQTAQHIDRLEQVFEQLDMPARGKKCIGVQNLIKEGQEMMAEANDDDTLDALMIAAAQKIEHYEIASYGTLRVWADILGHSDSASLLEETLDEEKDTDHRLTSIAESFVNREAADTSDQQEGDEQTGQRAQARARQGATMTGRQQAADRSPSGSGRARSRR